MGFKMGIAGCGSFGNSFVPLYKAHPLVAEVVIADLVPERVENFSKKYGVERTCSSLDELLKTDVDAVAIITQRHLHGPMVIQALKAGKHVYSAVPMAIDIEDVKEIIRLVKETGLIYMVGETSYYYPETILCRKMFKEGKFGEFVYGEAQYLHDMSEFYQPYMHSGGPNWKRIAGFPPMFYPTHSVSMMLGVTGAHVTQVSCMGYRDHHEDGIFGEDLNDYQNPFSNETALMRTSDGGCCRINEFRRVPTFHETGTRSSVFMSMMGTKGGFENAPLNAYWVEKETKELIDVSDQITLGKCARPSEVDEVSEEYMKTDFFSGVAPVHNIGRLPKNFSTMNNGHLGSHQFLVDDFCKAVTTNKLPPLHAWAAAAHCIPGLVAHASAIKGGELMDVPYMGEPPADWPMLNPDD